MAWGRVQGPWSWAGALCSSCTDGKLQWEEEATVNRLQSNEGTSVTRARALGGWWERSGNSQLCLFPMEWSPEATFSFLEEAVCLPWKQVHL